MSRGSSTSVFLGIDVGTGSARAGIFDQKGKLLGSASSPIQIWKEKDCIEQSSTDIWHAVCAAVKSACSLANVAPEDVVGLGFAATCSLVAVDADDSPVSVSWTGDTRRNIIVWMDHRAVNQAERINASNSPVLQYCGGGVSPEMQAPKELGLLPGTPVGTPLIDAHAGGVGVMESVPDEESKADLPDEEAICRRMVLVCGTSTCHMAVSKNKLFVPGVWGPFWSAMVPEFWLTEGGQSATGALLDYIVENHVAAPLLSNRASSQSISIYELLNKMLLSMSHEQNSPFLSAMTQDIHVLPDFHGNRSPIADPKSKGVIYGLTLDTSEKHLALLYLATIQGIAYGTRHIVEHCNAHGHKIDTLLACGGLAKNSVYIQEHADIIGKSHLS
ncbi:FGGY carbohydrate kinase domain-containing protein, partial [Dichanthelium oligosanthes]